MIGKVFVVVLVLMFFLFLTQSQRGAIALNILLLLLFLVSLIIVFFGYRDEQKRNYKIDATPVRDAEIIAMRHKIDRLKIFLVVVVIMLFVLILSFYSSGSDNNGNSSISETDRVKDLVRNSDHLSAMQKEVFLNAISNTCESNIGYMQGEKIGDAVLAKCLNTYEKKAKGLD